MRHVLKISGFTVALVLSLLLGAGSAAPVSALSGSEFKPGQIIDDALFYDGATMTAPQIQAFLDAKIPACDTQGSTGPYWDKYGNRWNTRADYGRANSSPPPYTCLKEYRQNTGYKAGESGLCSAIEAKTNRTAAQIIDDVARACHISQKVILVMLQKEQGLVTDDWPWPIQYRSAMGYGCPDTAACDAEYYGFFNQVYNAARQFQRYKADPNNWNHVPFMTNQVLYQANAPSCGSRSVYIENYATAGLYNYTPYTPNAAALDNLYDTGDSCSAYGNRNFWRYYNDWFGSTHANWPSLDDPRRMVTNKATYKINPFTGQQVQPLPAGQVILFSTKIDNCLRTAYDTANRNDACVKRENLSEFTPTLQDVSVEEKKLLISSPLGFTYKIDFIRDKLQADNSLYSSQLITFAKKTVVAGSTYYITQFDLNNGLISRGVRSDRVKKLSEAYEPFMSPRYAHLRSEVSVIDTFTQRPTEFKINANTHLYFNRKVGINKKTYYLSDSLKSQGEYYGVEAKDVINSIKYSSFVSPRTLKLTADTHKLSLSSNSNVDNLSTGTLIYFNQKLNINGKTYYRSSYDEAHDRDKVIDASLLVNP